MDNAETPSAEQPVAAAPANPVVAAEAQLETCVVCKESVRIHAKTHGIVEGNYGAFWICALCECMRSSQFSIEESIKSLPRMVRTKLFMDSEVLPILRKAGVFPKSAYSHYAGYVTIRPFDREQGMRIAGLLGGLLVTARHWSKEQEYNEAFFKLQGTVKRGDLEITLVINGVAPSESCTVTYEEVDVPARKEKRAKITCKEADPSITA